MPYLLRYFVERKRKEFDGQLGARRASCFTQQQNVKVKKSVRETKQREEKERVRVQKAASRVPSAPYNAKCHSNMSSSKGSAHVANALGSVSMCASESMNSFISCEMRRTALFEEENFEVESVVMSSSSSSLFSSRLCFSHFRVVVVCGSTKSKGSFLFLFLLMKENIHWVSFCARARGKFTMSSSREATTRTTTRRDDIGDGGDDRLRRPLPEEDAAEEDSSDSDFSDDDDDVERRRRFRRRRSRRCLRTETSRSDEEGTTEDDGTTALSVSRKKTKQKQKLFSQPVVSRLRIIAREKAEVVTTSFESVVLPLGRRTRTGPSTRRIRRISFG